MNSIYGVIWGFMLLAGGSAIWALIWAIRDGQFTDWQRGAESIFDDESPEDPECHERN